jgi:hypothetical protein
MNSESLLRNDYLAAQSAAGLSPTQVLLDQFAKTTLVYFASSAPGGFYNSSQPYLTGAGAAFALLGMVLAFRHSKEPRYLVTWVWFWAVVILGGVLTVNAPASERLVGSLPPLALFVALGLHKAVGLTARLGGLSGRAGLAVCAAVVAVISVQGTAYYFGEYRRDGRFNDASNELILEATQYALQHTPEDRLYLIAAPRVLVEFDNFKYLAPAIPKENLETVTADVLDGLPHEGGALFVAAPEKRADLEIVARHVPGGHWFEVSRRYVSEPLYFGYQVPGEVWAGAAGD